MTKNLKTVVRFLAGAFLYTIISYHFYQIQMDAYQISVLLAFVLRQELLEISVFNFKGFVAALTLQRPLGSGRGHSFFSLFVFLVLLENGDEGVIVKVVSLQPFNHGLDVERQLELSFDYFHESVFIDETCLVRFSSESDEGID